MIQQGSFVWCQPKLGWVDKPVVAKLMRVGPDESLVAWVSDAGNLEMVWVPNEGLSLAK